MQKSTEIKQLAVALLAFQKEIQPVIKDATNPFFRSKYADLASILSTIKEPLQKANLSFSQFPTGDGGLTTILMHNSGEWIEETFQMRAVDSKPQTYGSMITYMRRYALSAVLGLSTEEDDDGNAASKPVALLNEEPFPSPPAKWQKKGRKKSTDKGVAINLSESGEEENINQEED